MLSSNGCGLTQLLEDAYFFIKGLAAEMLAGLIREAIILCFDAGVTVRTVCMDGTVHNTSPFNTLGCTLQRKDVTKITKKFPHPHDDAQSSVFAYCDPPHMAKNIRNLLAEYQRINWAGIGVIQWQHIKDLQCLQRGTWIETGKQIDCQTCGLPKKQNEGIFGCPSHVRFCGTDTKVGLQQQSAWL